MIRARRGFTLVEILVTVAIIGAISALVLLPNVLRARLNANDAFARTTLKAISSALETYALVHGVYPNDTDLLLADAPPYLQTDFFDSQPHNGFTYAADTLTAYAYEISAIPLNANQGTQSFTMSTGGVLKVN